MKLKYFLIIIIFIFSVIQASADVFTSTTTTTTMPTDVTFQELKTETFFMKSLSSGIVLVNCTDCQAVEGYTNFINYTYNWLYPTYRGTWTPSFWEYGCEIGTRIEWETDIVPTNFTEGRTTFIWSGSNGIRRGLHNIYLNDKKILTFNSNQTESKSWRKINYELYFDFKNNNADNSGVYYLTVPSIELTQDTNAIIKIEAAACGSGLDWIMLNDFTDTIEYEQNNNQLKYEHIGKKTDILVECLLDEDCNDNVDCTYDYCNVTNGKCEKIQDNSICDDNLWCNGQETCDVNNGCLRGTSIECDDQDLCTTDICDDYIDKCVNTYTSQETTCGLGVCFAQGYTVCVNGTESDMCIPSQPTNNDNNCDGLDDNCDGIIDNNYEPSIISCGLGICVNQGYTECFNTSIIDICTPKLPNNETCDNLDNDCDGLTDEDYVCDIDKDGVFNNVDKCPNTVLNFKVDQYGCSAEQFCNNINIRSPFISLICYLSDWKNNEWMKKPNDCLYQRNKCVAYKNAN